MKTMKHFKDLLETVVLTDRLRLLTLICYTNKKTREEWDERMKTNVSVEKLEVSGKCSLGDVTRMIAQLQKVNSLSLYAHDVECVDCDIVSKPIGPSMNLCSLI